MIRNQTRRRTCNKDAGAESGVERRKGFLRSDRAHLLIALLLGSLNLTPPEVAAQERTGPSSASLLPPRIHFEKVEHDFGRVVAGEEPEIEFKMTNQGQAPLEITDVRTSCGCTTAGEWTRRLLPGASGSIPIKLSTERFKGALKKSVYVTSNDPKQPRTTLLLKATIWKPIELNPSYAVFSGLRDPRAEHSRVISITNNTDQQLLLSEPSVDSDRFGAELKTVFPGKAYELKITTRPPLNFGVNQALISLKSTLTNQPTLTVRAYASVSRPVVLMPSQIILPAGPLPSELSRYAIIRATGDHDVQITEPSLPIPGVKIELQETQPGRQFRLNLVFPQGLTLDPEQEMSLRVQCSHPDIPELSLPVRQLQSKPYTSRPRNPSSPTPQGKAVPLN